MKKFMIQALCLLDALQSSTSGLQCSLTHAKLKHVLVVLIETMQQNMRLTAADGHL